jgi:predicted DNA-binding transcriptional regulator AlpA
MPAGSDNLSAENFDRLLWGARSIAAYVGRKERWLRRQLARGKAPPPVFRIGSAVVADPAEIDAWLESHKRKSKS